MKEKITYKNLNWEYEFSEEVKTIRRGKQWIGETYRNLNIYTADGNKIITFEFPTYIKFNMEIIYHHIDDYIIKSRKKKLEKLQNEQENRDE